MSNHPADTEASIRVNGLQPECWDPFTGAVEMTPYKESGGRTSILLKLAPYESRVLIFTRAEAKGQPQIQSTSNIAPLDLSSDWDVTFPPLKRTVHMAHLHSWTADEDTMFYSGHAVYEKTVNVPATFLAPRAKLILDFGPGTPVEPSPGESNGMRALLESPVHESAVVFVNGKEAGAIWHPPYELDVTQYLHAGANQFRIVVGNLAINEMAGRALPDYDLLNMRYGERFVPQGMQNLRPVSAGIVGSIHLVTR
jgi:hypothetical protein